MGLDMYLKPPPPPRKLTPKQLVAINEYFGYLKRPDDYRNLTMKEWCGINMEDVDMSLAEKYRDEYVHRYSSWDKEKKYGWKTIFQQITSWRKANQIHNWFVENVQSGIDDCGMYEVTEEQLKELLSVCEEVVESCKLIKGKIMNGYRYENGKQIPIYEDGEYIEDSSIAEELLPTTSGFFFGGTNYDQWYYEDVKNTINIIQNVLLGTDFEHEIVMYSSSW